MTTIAYKNGEIAADRLHTLNGISIGYGKKIFQHDGLTYGCCGNTEDISLFKEWVQNGKGEKPNLDVSFTALMVTKNGKVFHLEAKLKEMIIDSKMHAIGSGYEIALGAMNAGASAKEAVKVACKLDCYSGGKVDCINIK